MPRADPSLVNHSYFDVTKDHLAVNPDTLLCRFFQFPSLLLPEILPSSMHIYASVACYPHSIVTKKKTTFFYSPRYLYAFQSCSLCLLCFRRWPSHTRLLCPTEGEPTNKTQYCWFTTANQKTPASVRKQSCYFPALVQKRLPRTSTPLTG